MKRASKSAAIYTGELQGLLEQYREKKYFDYFVFKIADYPVSTTSASIAA
jgi:hypothetical protein